jgi:hypothetical protein
MNARGLLACLALVVFVASGCGGTGAQTTPATEAGASATESTPTETGPGPMTADELAWLDAIDATQAKVETFFTSGGTNLTRSTMRSFAKVLRSCRRELLASGSPSDRLQAVYGLVTRACGRYDKSASCYAKAASVSMANGGVIVGTPEAKIQRRALACGNTGLNAGSNFLRAAAAMGKDIKAQAG